MEIGDVRTSFEMATVQIQKDAKSDDQIINTHSIVAALSFFTLWNAEKNTDEHRKKIMHAKEAVVLKLIKTIIHYSETCTANKSTYSDKDIAEIFFGVSVEWIACNMPVNAALNMVNMPDFDKITYEHPLHIAMAHYCYSQGVLSSNKTSKVNCQTHLDFEKQYQDKKKQCEVTREEYLEISEMYSEFSYSKLLVLCYSRLLKDSLYGHNYNENEDIYENAKQLLDLSVTNYNKVINGQITQEDGVVESKSAPAPVLLDTDGDSNPVVTAEGGDIDADVTIPATVSPEKDTIHVVLPEVAKCEAVEAIHDVLLELAKCEAVEAIHDVLPELAKREPIEVESDAVRPNLSITIPPPQADCVCLEEDKTTPTLDIVIENTKSPETPDAINTIPEKTDPTTVPEKINIMQMLSYKSAAGIFVMKILNFLKNDSVYTVDNMQLNLRHLIELVSINDPMVEEACQIVNVAKLIELVIRYTKNDPNLSKNDQLVALVTELQDLTQHKAGV